MIININNLKNKKHFLPDVDDEIHWNVRIDSILRNGGYIYDEENEDSILLALQIFAKTICWQTSRSTEYHPPKSAFIYGSVGSGKTFLMKILSGIAKIEIIDIAELEMLNPKSFGFWDFIKSKDDSHLIIDDLGTETDQDFARKLITHREKLWTHKGILTHYTSNITSKEELEKKYGTRIKSRILGQCETIKITGKDRRTEK